MINEGTTNRPMEREYRVAARTVCRRAYTLFEVLISLGISGLLIAGISSTILVASKAADSTGPTTQAIDSSRVVHQIATELAQAKLILGNSESEIEFIIGDVNNDGADDHMRYSFAGGSALHRSLNGGTPVSILSAVANFNLAIETSVKEKNTHLRIRSTPAINASHETITSSATTTIDASNYVSQHVTINDFAVALPAAADSWAIHGVSIRASQSGPVDGSLDVEIRLADETGQPTSLVLASESVDESSLPTSMDWVDVTFDHPVGKLNPATGVCIVCKQTSGIESAVIEYDVASSGGVCFTDSTGAIWSSRSTGDRMAFRLVSSDEQRSPLTLNTMRASHFRVSLAQHNSIQLIREGSFHGGPEIVAKFYESQFNEDPTTLDLDYNGTFDWAIDSPTIGGLADGVWSAGSSKKLQLATPETLETLTCIDISCRSIQAVGDGAILHVDADWQGSTYVPLTLKVCLQPDGTQRLELATQESSIAKPLVVLQSLPDSMLQIRLQINPTQDRVHLGVNGFDCGAFSYQPQPQPMGDPQFFLTNDIGTAEFDHISVRIMEDSP